MSAELSTSSFLHELCQHLPGWFQLNNHTIIDGEEMAIFSYHDEYRRVRIFGASIDPIENDHYYEQGERIRVNHTRSPESVAKDIKRKLLPGLPEYFARYHAWAKEQIAHRYRREGITKLLLQVSGADGVRGINPRERPMLYSGPHHPHWWQCEIQATSIEIRCRVTDPETAAAILELLRG